MKEVQFKVIPHKKQRCETPGDYFEDARGRLQFRVSDMRNDDYAFLVLIHELVEEYLCRRTCIKISEIDAFDKMFEEERSRGVHSNSAEAGHDPRAPYGWAHKFAEKIERLVAKKLCVNWKAYGKTVESLLPVAKSRKTV